MSRKRGPFACCVQAVHAPSSSSSACQPSLPYRAREPPVSRVGSTLYIYRSIKDRTSKPTSRPSAPLPLYAHINSRRRWEIGMVNKRVVQQRDDGNWEVRKPGADRASAVTPRQSDGIDRAREILANDGGGELQVRGKNGQIRAQDTIAPGNDPRSSKG
jgi:hypothetical protein